MWNVTTRKFQEEVISHTGICLNDHKKMYDRSAWGIFHEH
jgi:hypothetical protein